jgi:hypothetical protein
VHLIRRITTARESAAVLYVDRGIAKFFLDQTRRAIVRATVFFDAVVALVFWTAALLLASWLAHWGLGFLNVILGLVWLYLMTPGLVAQATVIADVVHYALYGRSFAYVSELSRLTTSEMEQRRIAFGRFGRRVIRVMTLLADIAARTSPFAGAARWASIFLVRHPPIADPREDPNTAPPFAAVQQATALEHKLHQATVQGMIRRQSSGRALGAE